MGSTAGLLGWSLTVAMPKLALQKNKIRKLCIWVSKLNCHKDGKTYIWLQQHILLLEHNGLTQLTFTENVLSEKAWHTLMSHKTLHELQIKTKQQAGEVFWTVIMHIFTWLTVQALILQLLIKTLRIFKLDGWYLNFLFGLSTLACSLNLGQM